MSQKEMTENEDIATIKRINKERKNSETNTEEIIGVNTENNLTLQNIVNYITVNVLYITKRSENLIKRIDYNKYLDRLSKRPWLATALILCTVVTVVSVTTFVLMIATTAAITLTGIALIEGTVITISTIIFCGCLLSIWILVAIFVIVGTCFYYGALHLHKRMQTREFISVDGFEKMKTLLKNELPAKEE